MILSTPSVELPADDAVTGQIGMELPSSTGLTVDDEIDAEASSQAISVLAG